MENLGNVMPPYYCVWNTLRLQSFRHVQGSLQEIVSACNADDRSIGFLSNGWLEEQSLGPSPQDLAHINAKVRRCIH